MGLAIEKHQPNSNKTPDQHSSKISRPLKARKFSKAVTAERSLRRHDNQVTKMT
jgi:hypothetical protein